MRLRIIVPLHIIMTPMMGVLPEGWQTDCDVLVDMEKAKKKAFSLVVTLSCSDLLFP